MSITQYLNRHAEPEIQVCQRFSKKAQYENVLVIPACDESAEFIENIFSRIDDQQSFLLILVINQNSTENIQAREANRYLWQFADQQYSLLWEDANAKLLSKENSGRDLLVLDRFSPGQELPYNEGVGLARKIGTDIATQLIHQGTISRNWIHNTDADATLPSTYFNGNIFNNICDNTSNNIVGTIHPFQHQACGWDAEENVEISMLLYEISLRYYVYSLQQAGSPYSHYTIGSTISFRACAYAKVRGFPKKSAGEDFYLLNKLKKVGELTQLTSPTLTLDNRSSNRVPFGTGPALQQISNYARPTEHYRYYHPNIFAWLKLLLASLNQYYIQCNGHEKTPFDKWFMQSNDVSSETSENEGLTVTLQALTALKFNKAIDHCWRQSRGQAQFLQHFHTWFDGFRTLKFVHFLRDQLWDSVPITEILQYFEFTYDSSSMTEDMIKLNQRLYKATVDDRHTSE